MIAKYLLRMNQIKFIFRSSKMATDATARYLYMAANGLSSSHEIISWDRRAFVWQKPNANSLSLHNFWNVKRILIIAIEQIKLLSTVFVCMHCIRLTPFSRWLNATQWNCMVCSPHAIQFVAHNRERTHVPFHSHRWLLDDTGQFGTNTHTRSRSQRVWIVCAPE